MSVNVDVLVAGSGVAGLSAGLTAARLGLETLVLTGDVFGGHLLSIEKIEGCPGFEDGVPGYDLCPIIQEQAAEAGALFETGEMTGLTPADDGWRVECDAAAWNARTVILATGTSLAKLGVPGEERLQGRGVSQCASCDAPLLSGKEVVVVGSGDSACQEALTLVQHVARVHLLLRDGAITAQSAYRKHIEESPNITVHGEAVVEEILGEDVVSGVRVRGRDGATSEMTVDGVFIFVGLMPNTGLFDDKLQLDHTGRILVDAEMRTTLRGVFAAGTVRAGTAGRAAAAAGDGTTAATATSTFLASGAWPEQAALSAVG